MRKKEGVYWFPFDADGNAGTHRVKFARNYKLVEKSYNEGRKGTRNEVLPPFSISPCEFLSRFSL